MIIYRFGFVVSRAMLASYDESGSVFLQVFRKFREKNGVTSWDI